MSKPTRPNETAPPVPFRSDTDLVLDLEASTFPDGALGTSSVSLVGTVGTDTDTVRCYLRELGGARIPLDATLFLQSASPLSGGGWSMTFSPPPPTITIATHYRLVIEAVEENGTFRCSQTIRVTLYPPLIPIPIP